MCISLYRNDKQSLQRPRKFCDVSGTQPSGTEQLQRHTSNLKGDWKEKGQLSVENGDLIWLNGGLLHQLMKQIVSNFEKVVIKCDLPFTQRRNRWYAWWNYLFKMVILHSNCFITNHIQPDWKTDMLFTFKQMMDPKKNHSCLNTKSWSSRTRMIFHGSLLMYVYIYIFIYIRMNFLNIDYIWW